MKKTLTSANYRVDLLVTLYVFCIITAELIGSKSFPLFKIFNFLIGLIILYWLLKVSMSAISTPFVYMGTKCLKKDDQNL